MCKSNTVDFLLKYFLKAPKPIPKNQKPWSTEMPSWGPKTPQRQKQNQNTKQQ